MSICARDVRRATLTLLVLLAVVLAAIPAVADKVDDLLFDFQMVPLDGQPSHEFTLQGLDGRPVSLSDFRGHVVLLYFWASW